MFANERRVQIAELVASQQSVTVSELTERFGVSIETIRRDLECLEKQRVLSRVPVSYTHLDVYKRQTPSLAICSTIFTSVAMEA